MPQRGIPIPPAELVVGPLGGEWEDMTPAEQEEVRQNFEEEGKELEEEFSDDSFAQYILDKVEQAIEE